MADGLDVVAVRVADEPAVVVGVVLRAHPRLLDHGGAGRDGGVEEVVDRGPARRLNAMWTSRFGSPVVSGPSQKHGTATP